MSSIFNFLLSSPRAQWAVGLALGLVVVLGLFLHDLWFAQVAPSDLPLLGRDIQTPLATSIAKEASTPKETSTPVPTSTQVVDSSNLVSVNSALAAYDLPANSGEGQTVDLPADFERVGWVNNDTSDVATASFPDFNIYAGSLRVPGDTLREVSYMGAVGFDLSQLDEYGPATAAELLLVGLSEENQQLEEGTWTVEILADDSGFWDAPAYETLSTAPLALALRELGSAVLGYNQEVRIPLSPEAVKLLNGLRYEIKSLTLRVRGPGEADSLFGFDGGVGSGSLGNQPRLLVSTEPLQPTPTPIIVTATPLPENVETAAVRVAAATRTAQVVGTATATPFNVLTATPTDESSSVYWIDSQGTPVPVIVPMEAPANLVTAEALAFRLTAIALTTGTATPFPERFVTATPTITPMFIIGTREPDNVMTRAAQLVVATAIAEKEGTPTPLPTNAIIISPTPQFLVVTSTPTPLNVATAQIQFAEATVQYITKGSPTPTPINQVTATPLPLLIPVSFFTPTPTTTPTMVLPPQLPAALSGKILFKSNRTGNEKEGEVFALDPVDGTVYSVSEPWVYLLAQDRLGLSPDGQFKAVVKPDDNREMQIQIDSLVYGDTRQLTTFLGAASYDPAWSSQGDRIAFVSTDYGNDEIYTINVDGSDQRRLTSNSWEWDKHPSWSPDGRTIVFWSNRVTGRAQLWTMDTDGLNERNISLNEFNDWDPIWIP